MKGSKCVKSSEQWVLDFHNKTKVFPDLSLFISFMKKVYFKTIFFIYSLSSIISCVFHSVTYTSWKKSLSADLVFLKICACDFLQILELDENVSPSLISEWKIWSYYWQLISMSSWTGNNDLPISIINMFHVILLNPYNT